MSIGRPRGVVRAAGRGKLADQRATNAVNRFSGVDGQVERLRLVPLSAAGVQQTPAWTVMAASLAGHLVRDRLWG
jgi:hypothetical protein